MKERKIVGGWVSEWECSQVTLSLELEPYLIQV